MTSVDIIFVIDSYKYLSLDTNFPSISICFGKSDRRVIAVLRKPSPRFMFSNDN